MNQNSHGKLTLVESVGENKAHSEPARRADKYSFAKYLRVIGQSLDAQNLSSFELAYHSGVFVVRGVAAQKWSVKDFVANIRLLLGREPAEQGALAPVQMHYTAEYVEELDAAGRTQRGKTHETPDPFSIAEQLRCVGSLIDAEPQGSLVSVISHGKRLEIRYESEKGAIRNSTRRMEHHFDAWKGLFQRRKNRIKLVK